MSFIRKISDFVPIAASQEPQTEVTPESQPQPRTSFGVAHETDLFETAPNNLYFMEEQSQTAALIQPSTARDLTVDASSLFSYFETSVGQLNNRLPQLMDRLDSLRKKRTELVSQIEDNRYQSLKAQEALNAVDEAIQNDKPIPDAIVPLLGPLGILGMVGGLPVLPVIGGIAGLFGLNEEYKQRMHRIKYELEKKMGESSMSAEGFKSELDDVKTESESVQDQIVKEKLRLEEEARPAQSRDPLSTNTIVAEEPWREFFPDQNQIQKENNPFEFDSNSIFQKKVMNGEGE